MKAVLQDIYRAIDQDDDESFTINEIDNKRQSLDISDGELDIYHSDDLSYKDSNIDQVTSILINEPVIEPQKTFVSTNISKKCATALRTPTDRLIEAIESLRYSIQENTQLYTRSHQRGRTRRQMSQYVNKSQSQQEHPSLMRDESLKIRKDKVAVEVRVVFLKIGEIDTLKELYHADVFVQAKWREPRLDGYSTEKLSSMDLDKYWNPLLYIDNILSETKEAQWLTASPNDDNEVTVVERRRVKGVFLETLELNDFPLDVQDLTITITTERPDFEIDIIPDQTEMSAINIQTFVDQQEWKLHEHVEITKRIILQEYSSSMKSHPCLSVTCRAARRPGYFYWNVFLIMFMISGLSFATFAVSPEKAEYRLRLSFTLVLTSVTFKYVITQSLPKISYLTYMDKYVLMSLAILCIVSIWHACITVIPSGGSFNVEQTNSTSNFQLSNQTLKNYDDFRFRLESKSPFMRTVLRTLDAIKPPAPGEDEEEDTVKKKLTPQQIEFLKRIERDVLISFGSLYILAHLIFIFWLYFDASKRRRIMRQKDKDYKMALHNKWKIM